MNFWYYFCVIWMHSDYISEHYITCFILDWVRNSCSYPRPGQANDQSSELRLKSKGFKKAVDGQCQTLAKVVNIWIFVFPEKENSTDWETSTEKPVQIALTFSLFFSAAPNFFLDFSQQLHNARKNSNCRILTLPIRGLFKSLALYGGWKL